MDELTQSDGLNASFVAEDDVKEKAENAKTEMEMTKRDVSNAEEPVKRAKNIREWGNQAYAVIHKCLEDPGGKSRQPTEADWIHYKFPDKETVQLALDYLVSIKRILFVNGEYQMLRKTRLSTSCTSSKKGMTVITQVLVLATRSIRFFMSVATLK